MKFFHFTLIVASIAFLNSCNESPDVSSPKEAQATAQVVATPKTEVAPTEKASIHADFNSLLVKYALANGVKYKQWKASSEDVAALDKYLVDMSKVTVSTLADQDAKAFYINLYNAAMIQAALAAYPTDSVAQSIPSFGIFKKEYIKLEGKDVSLDHVEKGILLKKWPDARIHFAVNCASYSCPPLRAEAFEGARLETQLDEQAKVFANSEEGAKLVDGKLQISSLFDWYASDFPGDPVDYLNKYRDEKLPAQQPGFIDYNWALNIAE